MIRVLLADDEALVRGGLRLLLEPDPELEIVAEATDGAEALTLARELGPDVILLDLHMPRLDGLTALARFAQAGVAARVLVLTTFGDDRNVYAALKAGAAGFLLKTARPEDLRRAIHQVAAGEPVVSAEVVSSLVRRFVEAPPATECPEALAELTDRELDVLRLIARGRSNGEIAAELFLGEATVKSHVNHILRKLHARDRVQAVVLAYEVGLVRPGGTA